jgi:hypothetical protein
MFTAMTRSIANAPPGVTPSAGRRFILAYPCKGERFDGYLMPEDRIAALHDAAGRFECVTADNVARLRALPKLPPPGPFTPRSHRWAGKPDLDYEGPRIRRPGASRHGMVAKHVFKGADQ